MPTWKQVYDTLYKDFGWQYIEYTTGYHCSYPTAKPIHCNKYLYSPTRAIAIGDGNIATVDKIYNNPISYSKLPPVKNFDRVEFDATAKLMFFIKDNMKLIALDIS